MGVQGLWTLLSPAGRKLKVEALEGQRLAIDVSIWVIRMLYGFASRRMNSEFKNIHLVGIFKRLCRLLSLGIKPVFVFDGKAPELKRHTLYLRQQQREKRQVNLKKLAEKYVIKQLEGKLKAGKSLGNQNASQAKDQDDEVDFDDLDSLNSDEMNDFEKNLNEFQMSIVDAEFKQILIQKKKYPNLFDGIISNEQEFYIYDIASKVGIVQQLNQRLQEIRNRDLSKITDMEEFSILQSKSYVEYVTSKKEVSQVRDEGRKNLLNQQQNFMINEAASTMNENQKKSFLNDPKNKIITGQSKSEHDKMFLFVQKAFDTQEGGEQNSSVAANKIGLIAKPARKTKLERKQEIQSRLNDLLKARESSTISWQRQMKEQEQDDTQETSEQLQNVLSKIEFQEDDDNFFNEQSINFADLCANSNKKQKQSKKNEDSSDLSFGDSQSQVSQEENKEQEHEENFNIKLRNASLSDDNIGELDQAMIQSSSQISVNEEQSINILNAIELQDKKVEESQRSSLADTQKRISEIVKNDQKSGFEILQQKTLEQSQRLEAKQKNQEQHQTQEKLQGKEDNFQSQSEVKQSHLLDMQNSNKKVDSARKDETNSLEQFKVNNSNTEEEIDQVKFMFDNQQKKSNTTMDDELDITHAKKKKEREDLEKLIEKLRMEEAMKQMNEQEKKKFIQKNQSIFQKTEEENQSNDEDEDDEDPEEIKKLLAQVEKWEEEQNKHVDEEIDLTDEQLEEEYQRFLNLGELDSETIQDKFQQVRQLLLLFGVPWVEAPSEAEAQCAFLEQIKLVDGIITDDSDVFLFGGKNIYRGLFGKEADYVRYINGESIEKEMGVNRDKLIYMALFLGSDYTLGIKGVGIVNAMEICTAFENIDALKRFKVWASKADVLLEDPSIHYKNISLKEKNYKELHKNYKKHWEIPEEFPSQKVINAYLNPNVDKSDEAFQWGKPSLGLLRAYCQNIFGWNDEITNYSLKPLEEYLNRKPDPQKKITDYYKQASKFAIINSTRLKNAIRDLKQNETGELESRLQNEKRVENIVEGINNVYKNIQDKKRKTIKKGAINIEIEEEDEEENDQSKPQDENDDHIDDEPFDGDLNGFQYNKKNKKKRFYKKNIF
ncbi:XPG amine-terminal domain protein (macronuclear) [Tetrahymena thermophila SB210]|uniref:XPG amine-terminal domain protein n=1 Tax=Tetrahymena thermophila (strain SB210) TaxID=312017 RepID=I7LXS7_TETTS|nr:XPG amine-terminal domain protein [Tetrahymena thermophila SB210]EAS06115.1 XPG amine-terminal domain protein [Tetrahymena thermophila SB210]|eukprot:XP_001026360.1 XPG amine-terminal domain protein [Tetrahymena thermophila SB210]